jgi:hypothetical protein
MHTVHCLTADLDTACLLAGGVVLKLRGVRTDFPFGISNTMPFRVIKRSSEKNVS